VAAEGLSREYVDDLAHALEGQTLIRTAIDTKEGLILDNIQTDPRAVVDLARREGLRSTILMPLVVEGIVLGAIALFCRRAGQYTKADYDVVGAVSNQIALAARQAEYYAAERRQAASLAALYRLSHELSKHLSAKDVAEHAFPIIQEELASRRMWLGVINEQATHLVGQAGFGPGVRQSLVSLQVELTNDDDFLNRAIRTRQPVVVEPDQIEQCVKLKRVLTRLKLGTFVVVPLQALSQMVGALVIEPSVSSAFFAQKKLPLLTSMAGEIATVLLARRFEARMSEAEKMRMAGLLASGVAHNFNNMLQAVMGQASLIEMQSAPDSPQRSSAGMILDAATRGAGLVKQLLTFTVQSGHKRERLSLSKLLNESRDLYRSILGAKVQLDIDQGTGDLPDVLADYSQVQHVISNLLVNAREALAEVATGRVQIAIARVALESGEVDPTLPPGDYLRLNVEDNGPGMDAERRARCFEPFYTTKNFDSGTGLGYAGTGLGLSSAYSIMKQHDGSITVQSAPGRGSSFSLFFRAVPPLAVETEFPERSLAAGSVALIGWEGDLASPFIAALKGLGVDAVAVTAAEALLPNRVRSIAQHRSVVIDIDAVGTGGISFIQSLKAAQPGLQVALIAKEPTSWSRSCEGLAVTILDRPRGIWALHAVAKRLFGVQARSGLREQLQIESAPVVSLESGNSRQDAESQGEGVIVGKVGFGNKGGGS
jgi:signal transduction histidine kinase